MAGAMSAVDYARGVNAAIVTFIIARGESARERTAAPEDLRRLACVWLEPFFIPDTYVVFKEKE